MGPPRTVAALTLGAFVALLGFALARPGWRLGDLFQHQSYDSLHTLATPDQAFPATAGQSVAIVYLDLNSFLTEHVDALQPWPRELHARLVRRLTAAGARAIVFDIVFGGPGPDPAADRAFAEAIRESGRVILAGEASAAAGSMTEADQPSLRLIGVEAPVEQLATNAAAWGAANHVVEDDFVIRRNFAGFTSQRLPSLAWATAEWLGVPGTTAPGATAEGNRRWLRYYGPALSLPHLSYSQALGEDGSDPGFFRDKVVFVGARPMTGLFHQRQDEFRSPFHSWRNRHQFHPGVEIHATSLLNLMENASLRRTPVGVEAALVSAVAVLFGAGLLWLRPLPATAAALLGCGCSLGFAIAGFRQGTWFPWLVPALAQIPAALFGSWLFQFGDWYTTRRRLEAARIADEARIREQAALIDKATDAISVRDLEGRFVYANPAAALLHALKGTGAMPATPAPALTTPESLRTARKAALQKGEWQGEVRLHRSDGRELVLESRWTLIRDITGQPASLLVIDTDVTERRQLEAEAHRLQRTEAIGSLASGMAHDLNNALAPVLMGTQLLRREAATDEARRILQLMESSTRRGADMVRQVVLFARGRPGEAERLDLRVLVSDMERLARDTFPKSIAVATHLASDLWPVRGNPTEIHQVLLNLCVNARDAMPAGGTLDLVLDNVQVDEATAQNQPGARPGDFVSLLVSDSGTGIPAEVLPRIFEPFFTTKPTGAGTGLGLSTTARIIRAHGGFLQVSSPPGEGTTFEVFLPRWTSADDTPTHETEEPLPMGQGQRVLIADDDQAVRELLRRALEDHGYTVHAASTGNEAIEAFRASGTRFDLVLCDCDMPGLSGPRTLAALRELAPNVPCLLMTGQGEGPEPGATSPDNATPSHLPKPFPLPLLLRRVHEAITRAR